MKKVKIAASIMGIIVLLCGVASAQDLIDFENMQFDVLADATYQAATPFYPGVLIETIDNATGDISGWPVVVKAYENFKDCGIDIPPPEGEVGAFDSRYCATSNTTRNYPVPSGYNSLSDTSEGLPPEAGTPRKQDGFLVQFDYPITDFSVGFADWGDYFPNPNTVETFPSFIRLIAYDGTGTVVASTNGPSLTGVDSTRDAADVNGLITLGLSGLGIVEEVEIRFMGKIDPGVAIDDITFTRTTMVDLCAGQHDDVGDVLVWDDGSNLYVKYLVTEPDTCLTETHLHVATSLGDIPQTKKNNPIPGQFDYNEEHDCVTEYTYQIPLDSLCGDLYIAAHAVVQIPSDGRTVCASAAIESGQGLTKGGGSVSPDRSNPDNATGPSDSPYPQQNFLSLGFGGYIILSFPSFVGGSLTAYEITWGSYPPETADVYVSRDGATWTLLGTADNSNNMGTNNPHPSTFLLGACIEQVKIVDTTDSSPHANTADAFDLDAVCAEYACAEETAWGDGCYGATFNEKNWATYFTYTAPPCDGP